MSGKIVSSSSSSGIGVVGALGVLFVALKLLGFIDWSWWWVTLPFWGGFALFFFILILAFVWIVVEDLRIEWKRKR